MATNSVSNTTRIVVFLDSQNIGFPTATDLRKGIDSNITIYLILAFYLKDGPADAAKKWAELSDEQKLNYVQDYHKPENKIKIMVSVGGATVHPTTEGWNAEDHANKVVTFVKHNHLDGVDLDWEDRDAHKTQPDQALKWIETYTQTLRTGLGVSSVISHSVEAAYFCPTYLWGLLPTQNFYYKVNENVGDKIDFYNIMFFNAGSNNFATVQTLIDESIQANLPNTALLQIPCNPGYTVPINKLVIGKMVEGSDGYMTPEVLAESVKKAMSETPKPPKIPEQWKAGIMVWQYFSAGNFHTFVDPSAKVLAGKC